MSETRIKAHGAVAALDAGLSFFTGAAAAFFVFAMPQDLFEALVVRSGLGRVLPAAQPPLGADARWAAVAAAGLVAAALVWTLMKALDRRPAASPAYDDVRAPATEPVLRLRKADAHPDAPARAPILASEELGEPLDLLPEDVVAQEPVELPGVVESPEPPRPIPSFLQPEQLPEPVAAPAPAQQLSAPAEPEPEGSLGQLMQRFESGLARKKQAIDREPLPLPAAAPAPAASTAASVAAPADAEPASAAEPDDRVGHRLRSAIAGLNRMSANGS
jgi:hypothetical protein